LSTPSDDTFLIAHKILPLSYSFSAPISPISIRDQMIRAEMFVDHAVGANLVGYGKDLLVVGAGAAGASLAIEAARRDIRVVLIEQKGRAFDLQLTAARRWIDPTQYDWPHASWTFGTYPWRSPLLPAEKLPDVALRWPTGKASTLAFGWRRHLEDAVADPKKFLTFHRNTKLLPGYPREVASVLEAAFDINGTQTLPQRFGCVVYALGFGSERVPDGDFRGFKYWDDDPWDRPDLGTRNRVGERLTVAICGAGDGALQDFLRIVTGMKSAKDLMTGLEPLLPPKLGLQLAAEEDTARRHSAWLQDSEQDHLHLKRLHSMYESAVAQTLLEPGVKALVDAVCGPILKRLTVTLYYSCDHFSHCFPLNHFLVLLILRWADLRGDKALNVIDKVRLVGVKGVSPHVCKGDKNDCHMSAHDLKLVPAPTCGKPGGSPHTEPADIVIVRLGTDSKLNFDLLEGRSIPRTRQLLPYMPLPR
jgi:FAD binding domain